MTKLEGIRWCKPDIDTVIYVLPAKPSGIQIGVGRKGFVLQVNGDEPMAIKDAAMKRMYEWLRDCIYAEAD